MAVHQRPATPTEKEESGYGLRVNYILKDLYVTVRTDYYDHRDRLLVVGVHNAYRGAVVIRSDTDGRSWLASDALHRQGIDETSIAQLPNGSLAAISRNCEPSNPHCQHLKSDFTERTYSTS